MRILPTIIFLGGLAASALATTCKILSLSGGGSHGAFESGVLSKMVSEPDFVPWDVYTGVSAGALSVLSLLKDDYPGNMETVRKIWWATKTKDVLSPFQSSNSISGNAKVLDLITNTFNQLSGDPTTGEFRVGVVDLESGEFLGLPLIPTDPDLRRVLASTSIPLVFPPVEIPELGIVAVDGGLESNEMVLSSLQYCPEGTTRYELDLVFANMEKNTYKPPAWDILTIASRTLDIMFSEFNNLYFKEVSSCEMGPVQITIHMPQFHSDVGALDFDHGEFLWKIGFYNSTRTVIHC
jgi:predicted patatin/cPLA2 family phospholipase